MRPALSKALAGCLALLSVAALSACGGSANTSSGGSSSAAAGAAGSVVDVYSSLPMQGPYAADATAITKGIRLALAQAHGRAGPFTVQYAALDDSAGPSGWDASVTATNARKVAADPRAVYYIGEFDDDASEVSMPILNEAGIAQVSPANTYVGLTTSQPWSAPGEPGRSRPERDPGRICGSCRSTPSRPRPICSHGTKPVARRPRSRATTRRTEPPWRS